MASSYAAAALGDSEFGLHLAEQANPREAGLLFYVSSAAEHVEDALSLIARYCRIGNEAGRLKCRPVHWKYERRNRICWPPEALCLAEH
jgi:Arabinose-binding domain of AraC transcription regulator, N-term